MNNILDKVEEELVSINYGIPSSPSEEASWICPMMTSTPKPPTPYTPGFEAQPDLLDM